MSLDLDAIKVGLARYYDEERCGPGGEECAIDYGDVAWCTHHSPILLVDNMPELVAEVERLRAENSSLRHMLDNVQRSGSLLSYKVDV